MTALEIGLAVGIGLIFLIVQLIIVSGTYSFARATAAHEVIERGKKLVRWVLTIGFCAWLVAFIAFPAKTDVAIVGGATLLMLGGIFTLPLLARMGKLSQRAYVIARMSLIPVIAGAVILISELRN